MNARSLEHGSRWQTDMHLTKFGRVWPTGVRIAFATLALLAVAMSGCGAAINSGGGGSGGEPNPLPAIVALDPTSVAVGGPDFYLTADGTGFVASSVVQWGGSGIPTRFASGTRIFAKIPSGLLRSPATVAVTVFNPTPGGGVSNAVSVTLVGSPPPPPSGVGVLQLVSATPSGAPGNGASYTPPAISSDGRYVAFQSDSTDLVSGPASGFTDIYVRDTCVGASPGCTPQTTRVSIPDTGALPNGNSRSPSISDNGRYVVFDSSASNLVPNDTNNQSDVFLRDTCIGVPTGCTPATLRISIGSDSTQANDDSRGAATSGDARFVAYSSSATNLVANDTNGWLDIFLRDTCLGAGGCTPSTIRLSLTNNGAQSNAPSAYPSLSADGRYVAFRMAGANNLVPNDPNASAILRDTCFGGPANCQPGNRNLFVGFAGDSPDGTVDNLLTLSGSGRFSGFGATATNLVPGDTNQALDAFVYDDCIGASAGCVPHTDRVSVSYIGAQANSSSAAAVSSSDGAYAVFVSIADNLLPYVYRSSAVYVRETCKNAPPDCVPTTYLLSLDSSTGIQGNSSYSDYPAITSDGRYATFISNAANWPSNLQSNGLNQVWVARVY